MGGLEVGGCGDVHVKSKMEELVLIIIMEKV